MTDKNSHIGLYLHIPFCSKKCAYCDFYSAFYSEDTVKKYTSALIKSIEKWGGLINRPIDTIYLGGGTPSLLKENIIPLISAVKSNFVISPDAEITMEINPCKEPEDILGFAKQAGVNRLSVGIQSGNDSELKILGRTHSCQDAENTFKTARKLGFENISADIMLGLPYSDFSALKNSIDFIIFLEPEHISAYLLKIEENTLFFKEKNRLALPDEDIQAEQYLFLCDELERHGYRHYEISNFCKEGFASRHNTKYWMCEEYLGLGPSAHSFIDGKRFNYPRDLAGFIKGNEPVFDSYGGDENEYIMLSLRLDTGISFSLYKETFGKKFPESSIKKARLFEKAGHIRFFEDGFALTNKGMLVSNSIIAQLENEL